jgi:hypothetical protein
MDTYGYVWVYPPWVGTHGHGYGFFVGMGMGMTTGTLGYTHTDA